MNYSLSKDQEDKKVPLKAAFLKMAPMLSDEKAKLVVSFIMVLLNSGLALVGPLMVGYTIDTAIANGDYGAVLVNSAILLGIYLAAYATSYIQMKTMGGVAQRMLFKLRNEVFGKLQSLPLAFFNQNKAGDLISRINSDTEKLNMFFSQGLMRFVGNIVLTVGAGVFILFINWKLALAALIPGVVIIIFTQAMSRWVKSANAKSLSATGLLSAEIQESIANFKVILAFNRRDYFKARFGEANQKNYKGALGAGMANELFSPVYELCGNIALLIVLGYGISLIAQGQFAVGLLVSFVLYVTRFYDPLREMARLWSMFQVAMAAWDRIGVILHMESNLIVIEESAAHKKSTHPDAVMEFKNVSFGYDNGKKVLNDINFTFEKGKTYALVGPTGGGKTTTASLVSRLFDPTEGTVFLHGKDIRSYSLPDRAQKIGFILQEPFMFTGTVRENLLYGNPHFTKDAAGNGADLEARLKETGLDSLLSRFSKGLDTPIGATTSLSLGEKQLIAFIRAVLRKPDILILDEATANIDTVTEELLQTVLDKLPKETTRIVIAHRLNTIENADDIFFVNGGEVVEAGSMEHAVDMLLHGKRKS
ncbi:MAG TPA: ABC transporter ATP-binding protein [Candidatus Paceibacterota bacterium]